VTRVLRSSALRTASDRRQMRPPACVRDVDATPQGVQRRGSFNYGNICRLWLRAFARIPTVRSGLRITRSLESNPCQTYEPVRCKVSGVPLPPTDGKRRDNVFPCPNAARSPSDRGQRIVAAPSRFAGFALYRAIALALAALSAASARIACAKPWPWHFWRSAPVSLCPWASARSADSRLYLGSAFVSCVASAHGAIPLPCLDHGFPILQWGGPGDPASPGPGPLPHGPARVRPPLRIPTPDECVPHHTRRRFEIAAM